MKTDDSHEFLPHPRPYYPWLILSISLFFQYYKQLLLISPSVMVGELALKYSLDTDQLGLLTAMAMYSFFIFQIPFAILIDKWGVRRISSLAILITALGSILFGYAPTATYAFIGRFLIGLGSSVALVNIVKIVANWFKPTMFAFLIGVAIALGALGDLTGIYLTEALVQAVGVPTAMLNYGLLGIIFAIIFFLVVRDNAPGAQYDINPKVQRLRLSSTILRMLKRKQSWVIALFSGFAQTTFPVFLGLWGIAYLRAKYQYSEAESLAVHASFFVGLILSSPLMGHLSTRLRRRKVFLIVAAAVATLLSIGIGNLSSPPISLNFAMFFLQGVAFGTFLLCLAVMREQNVSLISATSFAFANSAYAIFAAISDQAIGTLFNFEWHNTLFKGVVDVSSNQFYSFLLRTTLWLGLSLILSFFIKETYAKQKIKEDLPSDLSK